MNSTCGDQGGAIETEETLTKDKSAETYPRHTASTILPNIFRCPKSPYENKKNLKTEYVQARQRCIYSSSQSTSRYSLSCVRLLITYFFATVNIHNYVLLHYKTHSNNVNQHQGSFNELVLAAVMRSSTAQHSMLLAGSSRPRRAPLVVPPLAFEISTKVPRFARRANRSRTCAAGSLRPLRTGGTTAA